MKKASLYFATNRKHEGPNRWKPKGYAKQFSSDGHFNLRFGELAMSVEPSKVNGFLNKSFGNGRTGDGEGLSGYLTGKAKTATIKAYRDGTARARKAIDFSKNSSTQWFKALKKEMENGCNVLVYIHGYNVSWEEAVGGASALQLMLNRDLKEGQAETRVVLFSWPSRGSMMPWAAYNSDRNSARMSAQALGRAFLKMRDFLSELKPKHEDKDMRPCGQKINLLCHSMGNFALQHSLKKLIGYSNGYYLPQLFDNIFLCAADVDDNALEENASLEKLHQLCTHISVYHNTGDVAMHISDRTKSQPQRLGHSGAARPQLIHNKVHQVNCSDIVEGPIEHSYYLWATVNDDIQMTIQAVPFDHESRKRTRIANGREWRLD